MGSGYRAVADELGIERTILFRWIHTYQKEGREGLKEKRGNSMVEVYIGT
ncbi:helix-turn-helix domain-containing protein [Bacillus sp. CGMCC 1.60114]